MLNSHFSGEVYFYLSTPGTQRERQPGGAAPAGEAFPLSLDVPKLVCTTASPSPRLGLLGDVSFHFFFWSYFGNYSFNESVSVGFFISPKHSVLTPEFLKDLLC